MTGDPVEFPAGRSPRGSPPTRAAPHRLPVPAAGRSGGRSGATRARV